MSVYVEGNDAEGMLEVTNKIRQLINETRTKTGTKVDVLIAEGFNRHDQL
jgi:hypothetical protein